MAEAETKFNDVVLEKQSKQNYYDSKSGKEKSKRFQSLMDCHLKIKNPRERLDKKTTTQSTELSNLAVLLTILSAEKRSSKLSRALLISPALSEAIPKVFVFWIRAIPPLLLLVLSKRTQVWKCFIFWCFHVVIPVKIRSAEEVKFEALEGEVAEGAVKKLKVNDWYFLCFINFSGRTWSSILPLEKPRWRKRTWSRTRTRTRRLWWTWRAKAKKYKDYLWWRRARREEG